MKYLLVLLSFLFLFACAKEETKPVMNTKTKTGISESSGNILIPNEKTSQTEQEFANELNTLLNTVEEAAHE